MATTVENLQRYTNQIKEEYKIPAVSLAIWKDNFCHEAASGILNINTGVEATTDSIFQIGSITKVFTASLVMKLVEDKRVELDKPVKHYLRNFQIANQKASEIITVKQLLNHTNGIAGDYFPDDVHEDGPHIARYVDRCSHLPLIHPVGNGFSYSNSAFGIAGRLVEVVLGISWYDAMEELIFEPLGMKNAICRPQDTIRFRTALGHVADGDNVRACSGKYLCFGLSPAGTTPTMTAAELIRFGCAHLNSGCDVPNGKWLSKESIRLMQTPSANTPRSSRDTKGSMGLGWMLGQHEPTGLKYVFHSGGTIGQCAHLRLFPEHNSCIAVLLNRLNGEAFTNIVNHLTTLATGYEIEANRDHIKTSTISMSREELQPYTGKYHSYAGDYTISISDDKLIAKFDDAVDKDYSSTVWLQPLGEGCFEQKNKNGKPLGLVHFIKPNQQGSPTQLFAGTRQYQRIGV